MYEKKIDKKCVGAALKLRNCDGGLREPVKVELRNGKHYYTKSEIAVWDFGKN
jgi:hypothetical protein